QETGAGIAVTKQAVDEALLGLRKNPQLRMFYPFLKKIESKVDGMDVTWSVDLGRSRAAIGLLASAVVPFVAVSSDSAIPLQQAGQIEVVVEEVVEEVEPVEKPAGG